MLMARGLGFMREATPERLEHYTHEFLCTTNDKVARFGHRSCDDFYRRLDRCANAIGKRAANGCHYSCSCDVRSCRSG